MCMVSFINNIIYRNYVKQIVTQTIGNECLKQVQLAHKKHTQKTKVVKKLITISLLLYGIAFDIS